MPLQDTDRLSASLHNMFVVPSFLRLTDIIIFAIKCKNCQLYDYINKLEALQYLGHPKSTYDV